MKLLGLSFALLTLSSSSVFAEGAVKGQELFKQCITCHGDKGQGNPAMKAPKLAGQHDWYLLKQLQDMKAQKVRKNPVMNPFLQKLSEQDMKDLALYISKM